MWIYDKLEKINDSIRKYIFKVPKEPGITKIYLPGLVSSGGKGVSAIHSDREGLESKLSEEN